MIDCPVHNPKSKSFCQCRFLGTDGPSSHIALIFYRDQLQYDIENYAFIESHVADGGDSDIGHMRHMIADIGAEGNDDRLTRLLGFLYAYAVEMLYPFSKRQLPHRAMLDDQFERRDEYVIELIVPSSMSQTTMVLLRDAVHEWLVYRVLFDWLGITFPDAAHKWRAKADELESEIRSIAAARGGILLRPLHPW